MPQMPKVELYAAIRRDHRGGMTMREIERKYNVSWRTVRGAVDSVWPEPRKKLPPRPTALDPYKAVIDGILRAHLDAPRKQRHTVTFRTNRYSVPVRLIGKRVRVMLHASHLVVYDKNVEVALHERLIAKGSCRLELDHYLEALIRKPGAFPGATALEQARSAGKFTPVHDAWWAAAVKAHGDTEGTRALIEVLLMARHIPHEYLVAGLATALRAGTLTADAVALEARKAAQTEDEPGPATSSALATGQPPATVTFLHEWKLNHLPPDTRPLPSVTPYDQLLRRRASGGDHREGEAQ
ncbi:hypothetical protein OHA88_03730 [Streptomyces sp. NBC_00353]|uniref:Mu transposase domain-containing protein n=1 Tax=Streptomyces sp. NBC_00353 TaxID=2975722 RepID=UPI002E26A40C